MFVLLAWECPRLYGASPIQTVAKPGFGNIREPENFGLLHKRGYDRLATVSFKPYTTTTMVAA